MIRRRSTKATERAAPEASGLATSMTEFLQCGLDPSTADPRLLRQVRVLNSLMLSAMFLCIPLGIFWSVLATPRFALVYAVSFVIWAVLIFWLQRSRHTTVVGRAACCVLFGLCTASAVLLGSTQSYILAWYLLMPLAAAVCVGRRDLWFWGLIAAATPALLSSLPEAILFMPAPLDTELKMQLANIVLALGVLVASILTSIWISHHEQLAKRLDDSVAHLKKEAAAHRLLIDTAMLASGETELTGGARKLLGRIEKLDWISSVCFWDTRGDSNPDRPYCAFPGTAAIKPSPSLARTVRTGERSVSRDSESAGLSVYYPIRDRQEVAGVIEIHTGYEHDPIHEGDWLLQQIAIQLGHVAERERTAEIIQREARYDSLTSLPNRRAFQSILETEIQVAALQNHNLALLFIDLNGFKRINDSLGHAAGDEVLQVVARRLKQAIRESDMLRRSNDRAVKSISRVGGDEFTLVLDNIRSNSDADGAAQRILDALAAPIRLKGQQFKVGASIGIAVFPGDAQRADALIRSADTAMYTAKRRGRSGFSRFRASDKAVDSLLYEADIRRALVDDQFEMHYQAVFSCASGEAIGAEALIRWRHPQRGWVSPSEFIPIAEEIGLISEIGHFQFESVLRWFESSREQLPSSFRIALNLSPMQIEDPTFITWLMRRLADSSLSMNQLELEITETALLADTPEARKNLTELADLGLCITLDDFGTGQSSLSLLKRFPIGRLKIDRSFVSGLPERNEDVAIVSAVLSLAQSLGIPVVAEGVEDEAQRAFLVHRKCDDMQGFLLAKPMPGDTLIQQLDESTFMPTINGLTPNDAQLESPQAH